MTDPNAVLAGMSPELKQAMAGGKGNLDPIAAQVPLQGASSYAPWNIPTNIQGSRRQLTQYSRVADDV